MIAVITSCLQPIAVKSFFSFEERLQQTRLGLAKLERLDFDRSFLLDNSDLLNQTVLEDLLKDFKELEKYHGRQFQFGNKGLNEALLILNHLRHLPPDVPILKISGRYYPNEHFEFPNSGLFSRYDFIGIGENFDKRVSSFNTRAYFIKNKSVWETALVLAVEEILSYARGIHGLKSLFQSLAAFYKSSPGVPYQLSLEQALARVLKAQQNYLLINKTNIEGHVAGSAHIDFIQE